MRRNDTSTLIVIVNYRTSELTLDCLRSLEAEVAPARGVRVVVTDNGSGDGSVGRLIVGILRYGWSDWASVQPLPRNGGFAYGNNAAISRALESDEPPDFVILLNPDTVARPGSIRALIEFMSAHPEIGLAGSRLEDPDGTPQRSAFRFPSILSELDGGMRLGVVSRLLAGRVIAPPVPVEPCEVDWVAGASLIVRREVFEQIGLLDEGYFMYFEEVDFCRRARLAGRPCWYVPDSRVVHLVGQSSGVTDRKAVPRRRPAYWFEARRRYFLSHLGRARTVLADLAWSAGYASYLLRRRFRSTPEAEPPHLLRDFLRHNFLPTRATR
ncbi:MAG: glycosyl transferase family 2 [Planctomycetota bacterium]|nr:glycosyl transferase family 2 [Planctomycetota bacterium]